MDDRFFLVPIHIEKLTENNLIEGYCSPPNTRCIPQITISPDRLRRNESHQMYSTTIEACNLDLLRDVEGRGFLEEIQSAHIYLTPDQAEQFFAIVLSHFENEIPVECGKAILHSVCRILSKDDFMTIFVDKNLASALPFSKKSYLEDVFDVLYVLVTRRPQAFDHALASRFKRKIRNKGEKSLIILSIYAQHFNEIESPWEMLEFLFSENERFSKEDIADKYAALLGAMIQSYPEFRRAKGIDAWNAVLRLLEFDNLAILERVYNALATIASCLKHVSFPFKYILKHFQHPELQRAIMCLLLVVPIKGDKLKDVDFVKTLVQKAADDKTALLVLFRLAESKAISQILVEKDHSWMERDNPTLLDTLRLFLVVYQHKQLRPLIAMSPAFMHLMLRLVDEKNESLIAVVCIIIRRLELNEEIVEHLSSSGFIMTFLETVQEINTDGSSKYGLLLLDKIASVCYTRELVQSCEWIYDLIQAKGELLKDATILAIRLCQYKRCSKQLRSYNLTDIYKKLSKDPETKKISQKFLRAIDDEYY